jgi:DNA polymerase-3 subunit alpha/error-prone DNA polymerase
VKTSAEDITPLHVRSAYSLLRGTCAPDRLVDHAGRLGYARLALTEVNNLYGATVFWKLATAAGISPIVGAELMPPADGEDSRSVVALVENEIGYENLCRIITRIHCGGDPSAFFTGAAELSAGLHLIADDPAAAVSLLQGGTDRHRVWLGLDPLTQPRARVGELAACARRHGLGLVGTGKALLPTVEDFEVARLLAAIRLGETLQSTPAHQLPHPKATLRSSAELARQLADFPQAIANNLRLAKQCAAFRLLPRAPVFPLFSCPDGLDAAAYLHRLATEGVRRRYGATPSQVVLSRLEKELALIERRGFCEYFLVVRDIVQYARSRGAPVAGRGSGAGSLVAYVLSITNVCPIAYGIPFERFLNEGREDFPDLDVDFCWRIRDEAIDYAFRRWGADRVAMVSMHITFQQRSALRETAKAMSMSDEQVSRMEEGKCAVQGDELAQIRRLSRQILHLPRNLSVHPGGIVIGRKPIDHYVPVQPAPKGVTITQYDKDGLEDIRLVKLDLLGNRNLSTVRYACDLIRQRGESIDIEALPPDDAGTIQLLQAADTVGCNQLESPAMRSLLRMMRPSGVGDVMKVLALIRPGAASIGMKEAFIRRHLRLEPAPRGPAEADAILRDTYGVMLYEDDVMLVAAAMLGSSPVEGDRFRKAVQKCPDDRRRLELSREFLSRCRDRGIRGDYAGDLWVQMAKFNAYSFCRAHAASYAVLAYAAAYLKRHYPLEFWTAALNNNQSMYHPRVYVEQAKRAGIEFLPPEVNRSGEEFAIDGGAIRVGLRCVKGLGPAGVGGILEARGKRPFEGLSDFLCRAGTAAEEARALVLCGAFDWTGRTRPALMMELNLLTALRAGREARRGGWRDSSPALLAARPVIPDPPGDYSPTRKYLDQRRILGISTGPHLMATLRPALNGSTDADSRQLPQRIGRRVRIAGLPEAVRTTPTQSGQTMMFLTLDDEFGLFEATVFPDLCRRIRGLQAATNGGLEPLRPPNRYRPYIITGKVRDQYGAITITAEDIRDCQPNRRKQA